MFRNRIDQRKYDVFVRSLCLNATNYGTQHLEPLHLVFRASVSLRGAVTSSSRRQLMYQRAS